MRKIVVSFVCICMCMPFSIVKAEDVIYPVPPPALNASLPITLKKQKITITRDNVSVEFDVLNESTKEFHYNFSFAGAEFGWLGMDDEHPDRSYSELLVTQNGQIIALEKSSQAFLEDQDVTEILATYAINPNIVADPNDWVKNDAQSRLHYAELFTKGFFGKNPLNDKTIIAPEDAKYNPSWKIGDLYPFFPKWTVRNSYAWESIFPPGVKQNIRYSYRPLWGATIQNYGDHDPELLSPIFSWEPIEEAWGNLEEFTEGYRIVIQWLTFPVNNILWKDNKGSLTIEASFPDEHNEPIFVFISYGTQFASGSGKASLETVSSRSDSVTVVTVRK